MSAAAEVHRLGDGAAGAVLALVEHARSGREAWEPAHRGVTAVAAAPIDARPSRIGLFRGAPAVGYLLHRTARPAYAAALSELDTAIDKATAARLAAARVRIATGTPGQIGEYDLISGLTGLGLYQMVRRHGGGLLPDVLSYLVELAEPVVIDGCELPGWWCSGGPAGAASPDFPAGHANTGLAHGIAGPLALLSAAMIAGIEVPGHRGAIEKICAFLDVWRQHDQAATWWPEILTRAEYDQHRPRLPGPGRPSWCYGVPGIARAQQLAARATCDPVREYRAISALCQTLDDHRQLGQITGAGLCHGWAGLLHTTRRIAADAPGAVSAGKLRTLRRRMEDHLVRLGPPREVGLLDGRAGLGLIEHADPPVPGPADDWDACLLLTFPTRPPTDHSPMRKPSP